MTTPIPILDALHQMPLAVWLRTSGWVYPALEAVHIVAIALVFGTLWIVDLRLLGAMRRIDLQLLARHVIPWTLAGFALAVCSGLLMFITQAGDLVGNRAFVIKMCLLFAAGTNAALLHSRGPLDDGDRLTHVQAIASLLIWLAVIACGRWIAYV
ncbi:DUF6644 family protein [Uliginosibacterium sp. H1]|uniref:DUF6644 family protein n=1 Tax=Uliginosibacterium sp. H1 TaxID=3114757 RepID=UPI002E181201|nr:DUF6644 family protein [Uliginosibacterium sp. H1]